MPAPHTVVVSAFEPFGGADHNPSQDVLDLLTQRAEQGELTVQAEHDVVVTPLTLPVEFGRAGKLLTEAINRHSPALVIALGLAAGTEAVRLERVGLNLRDARIPDNAGAQPAEAPVAPQGPPALFSTLRLKAAHARIAAAGIPVALSLSAGSYVCNDLLYTALHHISTQNLKIPAGFVHVPDLRSPETPVSTEQATTALDLLIAESLKKDDDDATPLGPLH
ncbi:pyroglutamyl-peptidase I family protein [Nesterenkonia ebinurensis]|uniref:pyroglutamyl-peptidase I family protein n=1 Tax=Nesterenkonia ebinurensis TaxID=2608252 RepID=UPI00123D5B65|nr:pyroglutamyl-peptidase I [Nesterenkonia ebinurensis]